MRCRICPLCPPVLSHWPCLLRHDVRTSTLPLTPHGSWTSHPRDCVNHPHRIDKQVCRLSWSIVAPLACAPWGLALAGRQAVILLPHARCVLVSLHSSACMARGAPGSASGAGARTRTKPKSWHPRKNQILAPTNRLRSSLSW